MDTHGGGAVGAVSSDGPTFPLVRESLFAGQTHRLGDVSRYIPVRCSCARNHTHGQQRLEPTLFGLVTDRRRSEVGANAQGVAAARAQRLLAIGPDTSATSCLGAFPPSDASVSMADCCVQKGWCRFSRDESRVRGVGLVVAHPASLGDPPVHFPPLGASLIGGGRLVVTHPASQETDLF